MRELLFADDSALVAHSAEEIQNIVDAFSNASKKFGLKINIKKTEVLYQPNSTRTREEDIMVDGNKLNSVLEFTYLGSTISSDGCIDDEIQRRIIIIIIIVTSFAPISSKIKLSGATKPGD